jgi:feruloyl esterase
MSAVLALLLAGQASLGLPAASPAGCAALKALQLPDVKITEAVAVPANAPAPVPASPFGPPPTLSVAYCKVNGTVGREIRFTLLLPDQWNRKFMMGGGGGFVEGIDNQSITSVNLGYATVGTDTGHQGRGVEAIWALDNIERQLNFGHAGDSPRRRSVEGNHPRALQRRAVTRVFQRLLERRPTGVDGSAALSRRFRRHRLRRAGL